ncbi:circularly permuted type 2 ATP-grasp protein [Mucisphaera sp.]|uniref:circularly permuted type 2 ATP-grasp protein n=1 Tax=Mucisphaera sp. TaxID=2913024 RepID=UPI003D0D962D
MLSTQSQDAATQNVFRDYKPATGCFDELFDTEAPRSETGDVCQLLEQLGKSELCERQSLINLMMMRSGVTFSVYSDGAGQEKIFPFDAIPRVISATDWQKIEKGLLQRVEALNQFLADIYSDQKCIEEGIIPRQAIEQCPAYLPQAMNLTPPGETRVHIAGIDLIRDDQGDFRVLEDNLRTPSGVSYVLENRELMKRALPRVFAASRVRAVSDYPQRLRDAMREVAPNGVAEPTKVVLTPGPFNSAYFEHSYLARQMGIELVENSDLFVQDDRVYMHTTHGPQQVHVIYKRVDDDFLDPLVFRSESLLGVPGLYQAYARGNVTLINAIGNGVADDKGIYPYIPRLIKFYLGQDALIDQVETLICAEEKNYKHVLENLDKFVVKKVDGSGGYGMLMGPMASNKEREAFAAVLSETPERYIAQPLLQLSACPTLIGDQVEPRRVDLRPFVITGKSSWVLPGGLTRVALQKGSFVVNSSQGGGSKDTWVLQGDPA